MEFNCQLFLQLHSEPVRLSIIYIVNEKKYRVQYLHCALQYLKSVRKIYFTRSFETLQKCLTGIWIWIQNFVTILGLGCDLSGNVIINTLIIFVELPKMLRIQKIQP